MKTIKEEVFEKWNFELDDTSASMVEEVLEKARDDIDKIKKELEPNLPNLEFNNVYRKALFDFAERLKERLK